MIVHKLDKHVLAGFCQNCVQLEIGNDFGLPKTTKRKPTLGRIGCFGKWTEADGVKP